MKLVLLHAFPLGPFMWSDIARRLMVEAITPTFPGFDGCATSNHEPNLAVFADAVLAEVEGEFVVGGCSMGGYVVMELMRRAPERIAGVILMDTKVEADGEAARAKRHEVADGVLAEGVAAWTSILAAPLLGASTRANNQTLVVDVQNRVANADPAGVAWAQRAMAVRPDSRGTLVNWHKPALVIVGAEDELSPVSTAREMAELLPHGEIAVIEGAGHLAAWERPDAVAEAIAEWWSTSFPPGE